MQARTLLVMNVYPLHRLLRKWRFKCLIDWDTQVMTRVRQID
jgi:hypothetical protein